MAITASEAAAALGRIKTEKNTASRRRNIAVAREALTTEEAKQAHREAQQRRREREREEKERQAAVAQLVLPETVPGDEKRGPGRPRTRTVVEAGEKRGKGRPKGSPNKPKEVA